MTEIKFTSFEDIQRAYPIGKCYYRKLYTHTDKHCYYNDNDLACYRHFGEVEIIDENYCLVTSTKIIVKRVEGYIYDGYYWYPAYKMDYENKNDSLIKIYLEDVNEQLRY